MSLADVYSAGLFLLGSIPMNVVECFFGSNINLVHRLTLLFNGAR